MKISQPPAASVGTVQDRVADKAKSVESKENSHKATGSAAVPSKGTQRTGASVALSEDVQFMNQAREIARDVDTTRPERLAELKAQIQTGNYRIPSHDIADRLVEEHLTGHSERTRSKRMS